MAFSGVSECLPTLRFPARKGAFLRALGGERRRRVRLGGWGVSGKGQHLQSAVVYPCKSLICMGM